MRSATSDPLIAVSLLLALAAVGGCGESTAVVESGPIEGNWVAEATNGSLFLVITRDSLVYFTSLDAEDCADRYAYGLTPVGGNDYLLSSAVNFSTIQTTLSQVDDALTWRTPSGSALFQRAATDPTTLAVCAGGGDDPAAACASFPPVPPGGEVDGALEEGDAVERGRFYDVYSLQPAAPLDSAVITVSAVGFDAYLYLYAADGTLIAENDDGVEGFTSARLTLPLDPLCYRVEVTTIAEGTTGTYTLRID